MQGYITELDVKELDDRIIRELGVDPDNATEEGERHALCVPVRCALRKIWQAMEQSDG